MKTFCLTAMIAVFLLLSTNVIQAQTTQTQLNQVELIKQTIGTWKGEFTNKDSTIVCEMNLYGKDGIEGNQKWYYKDKLLFEEKFVAGYDKKSDKYIGAMISESHSGMFLMATYFTSKNVYNRIPFEYLSNPELSPSKATYEYKSNDMFIATFINKGKPTKTYTWVRIK